MNSRIVTLAGLIGLLSSLPAESAPLRGDAIRLQGTWRVAKVNGKPVDEGTDLTFTFSVHELHVAEDGVPYQGVLKYVVHPTTEPKGIDLLGANLNPKEFIVRGIYRIKGEELVLGLTTWFGVDVNPRDKPRPKSFEECAWATLKKVRPDPHGDPLPLHALARLGTTRLRHPNGDFVSSVAFSPDGKLLASACGYAPSVWFQVSGVYRGPCRIRLWDLATGRQLGPTFGPDFNHVVSVAFSPDGRSLASSGSDGFNLWDVATRKNVWFGKKRSVAVAFSPDGRWLAAACADPPVVLCDAATGKKVLQIKAPGGEGRLVAFSPDGKRLAWAGADQTIHVWDLAARKELCRFRHDRVNAIAFSPDGSRLASAHGDGTARLWDPATGKRLSRLGGGSGARAIHALAFSGDGKALAVGTGGGEVTLWDFARGRKLRSFRKEPGSVRALAFSRDGKRLAAGRGDQTICLWEVPSGKEVLPFMAHRNTVESVAYSPDGRTLASAGRDGTIRLWEVATMKGRLFRQLPATVRAVAFSPDGKCLAAAGADRAIRLWDLTRGMEIRRWAAHGGEVISVAFSPDGGKLVSGSKDQTVRLWDVATGEELFRFRGQGKPGEPASAAFSPDGRVLGIASHHTRIELREVATGRLLARLPAGEYPVSGIVFSPDRKTLALTGHGFCLRDASTGKELPQFADKPPEDYFGGDVMAFSPDGRTVATGGLTRPVQLWEMLTGKEVLRFDTRAATQEVRALAFPPDGKSLASAGKGDHAVMVWDVTCSAFDGPTAEELSAGGLRAAWADLGSADAREAYRAGWKLVAGKERTLAFLRDHLGPAVVTDRHTIARLIADLGSDQFTIRDKASRQLLAIGVRAEPALRRRLAKRPSLEIYRRIERLLESIPQRRRRLLRAVAVLERLGSPKAHKLLKGLTAGAEDAPLTREARATCQRLTASKPTP